MPSFQLDELDVQVADRHSAQTRIWREWCFLRVAWRHVRFRFLIMLLMLTLGGLLFRLYEPEKQHSMAQAIYFTWSLIFGEPPEEFPSHIMLQTLFFLVPVIGLTLIIEGIIDFAIVMRDRRRMERGWCMTMAAEMKDHVILVGLGKLGFRTYKLLRKLGQAVIVIEGDERNQFLEEIRRDGVPLFICDARREAVLDDANVHAARSIICATDNDLANLEVALDARRIAPDIRVVMRMFDQNMADKIRDGFDIRMAMSQSAISAPMFAMAAVDGSIVSTTVVDGRLLVMQRWHVEPDGPLAGHTVGDVVSEFGFSVISRHSVGGDKQLFPAPTTRLEIDDRLLVQGPFETLAELRSRKGPKIASAAEPADRVVLGLGGQADAIH